MIGLSDLLWSDRLYSDIKNVTETGYAWTYDNNLNSKFAKVFKNLIWKDSRRDFFMRM